MPVSTITLNGNPVNVVTLPTSPGFRSVDFSFNETVSTVKSIFTGQMQTQRWPGADWISGTASLPPLTQAQADAWISALMECRGMTNAFMIGDPLKTAPRGTAIGAPAADGTVAMKPGQSTLPTYGWTANQTGALIPGDYVSVAYRLYRVLDQVNSDGSGRATINIYPSLREIPSGPLTLMNPRGLFRLATNNNKWSADYTLLTNLSFQFIEYR